MIQFGNSSVADVKYGSQQIAKVCKGADVIWEKNGMLELTWGDDFYIALGIAPNGQNNFNTTSAKSGYGFYMRGSTSTVSRVLFEPGIFDTATYGSKKTFEYFGNFETNGTTKNTVKTSSGKAFNAYRVLEFPFPVYIQSVTMYEPGDANIASIPKRVNATFSGRKDSGATAWISTTVPIKSGAIRVTSDSSVAESTLYSWDIFANISNRQYINDDTRQFMHYANVNSSSQTLIQTFYDALYDSYTNSALTGTAIRKVGISMKKLGTGDISYDSFETPSSNTNTIWQIGPARWLVKFRVLASDYYAWKTQWGLSVGNNYNNTGDLVAVLPY